jgi:hypothetical protein
MFLYQPVNLIRSLSFQENQKGKEVMGASFMRLNKIELLFYDEAFFRREGTVTRGWYPRGSKSEIKCPMTFEKVGTCGAVFPFSNLVELDTITYFKMD